MTARYLPPVARPPHDPLTMVLDARLGWRSGELAGVGGGLSGGVEVAPEDGALALAPLPGTGRLMAEGSGAFGGLVLPRHAAWLPEGRLVILDVTQPRLMVLDGCECRLRPWPCIGADDARVPGGATGLAASCHGLLLCVPAAHRIIVLDPTTGGLRGLWHSPPGSVPWTPVHAVAVGSGLVAVADPARGGVHLCNRRGRALRFIGGLGAVQALTVDRCGRLHVQRQAQGDVLRIDLGNGQIIDAVTRPEQVADEFKPPPVRVNANGAIDIAPLCQPQPEAPHWVDARGALIANPQPDAAPAYPARATWISQALDSEIADCSWDRITLTATLPAGTRVEIASCTANALLTDDELADASSWQRAGVWSVPGSMPDALCVVRDWMLHSPEGRWAWLKLELVSTGRATPRVVCLALNFPRVSLRRYLPEVFGVDPIAAEFTDRWLAIFDRTLRDIETQVDEQARLFDPLSAPAVPEVSAREDFLQFLASWVGVTLLASWPVARRRHFLAEAPRLYPWRGTKQGLTAALALYLGLDRWSDYRPKHAHCVPCVQQQRCDLQPRWRAPRLVLEHFTLRRWLALGHARLSDAAKLWGQRIVNRSRLDTDLPLEQGGGSDGAQLGVTQLLTMQDPHRDPFHVHAHRMSIFVPAGCVARPGEARALELFIEAESPAHVQAQLVVVRPRFRVGVQATLGLDAVVGVRSAEVLLDQARLGRATVLVEGGSTSPQPPRGAGRMRVGMTTITH